MHFSKKNDVKLNIAKNYQQLKAQERACKSKSYLKKILTRLLMLSYLLYSHKVGIFCNYSINFLLMILFCMKIIYFKY